jgi:hypothetical protein
MMSVYSLVIAREGLVFGMPSPMIKKKSNKLPRKVVGMEGTREFG